MKPTTIAPVSQPNTYRNSSKSATRALDILEYFALMGRPLRTVEIAQAFGINNSSTDQLLKTLVSSAYLIFDPTGKRYYPSPRLVNFGSWLASNYFGGNRICELMRDLHNEFGAIVTLSIRHGSSMQIVDLIEPLYRAGTISKGCRVVITDSILGTAFLSLHSQKEAMRIIEQVCSDRGIRLSVSELRSLVSRIDQSREEGCVASSGQDPNDAWAIAVGLPEPNSGMKMVLGLGGGGQSHSNNKERQINKIQSIINKTILNYSGPE